MVHPVFWPKKWFFYPIGNTPPICLTQDLSPEKNAEILLLGCGDPRSILYTVFADLGPKNRSLDVTCCDWEPAVLARNILLLTMIVDGVAIDAAWPIFYHLFLEEASHAILMAQCRTLLQSSSSMKTWKDSKYGHFLRFCNENSLAQIRRHWALYYESKDETEKEREDLKDSFASGMKSVLDQYGDKMASFRAAGPLFFNMVMDGHIGRSYKGFWTTGVTLSKSSEEIATPYVNPTFAHSATGKNFNVHYGTDPLMAFHLAPTLASGNSGKQHASVTTEDLLESARTQFSTWYSSFKTRLSLGSAANIVIRFFVGEALAFCQALYVCKEQRTVTTGVYAQPWGGLPIVLDEDYGNSSATPAPLLFNVIESSNLADHVGIVNLMVATVPLLQRTPWSIIHTSTLLRPDPKNPPKSALSDSACGDVPTFSMLLGIAPSPHIWHFTPSSNKHEVIASTAFAGQLHEGISWRFASSFIPNAVSLPPDTDLFERFNFVCDETKLAQFFFAMYLRMFAEEDQMQNLRNKGSVTSIHKQNVIHYVRASFVAFLALVKGNVKVDWAQTMNRLIDLIRNDKTLMIGMNNYQDLICNLYLRNVHTLYVLTSAYMETIRTPRDRFHGWKDVPPAVCIVLEVPRKKLKCLEDMHADEIKTPMLQCEVYGTDFHNIYSSIHLTFGDILVSVVDGEPQVTIKDDPKGWSGNSSLIVTFYLPSWTLSNAPTATQLGLNIRSTPSSTFLMSRLGMRLAIFSTSITDTTHVHVVRHRPNNVREIKHLRSTPGYSTSTASVNTQEITMKFDPSGETATSLIIRKDIIEPEAATSLVSGSKVSTKPITDSTVLVSFGDHIRRFNYPFSVYIDRVLTRIARKSLYIELESPVRPDFSDFRDLSINPFAVAHDNNQINLLNNHYLNLDILPELLLPRKEKDLKWLSIHATMMFSGEEKKTRETIHPKDRGWLVNMKESIGCMLLKYAGLQLDSPMEWTRIFGLSDPDEYGIYTLIFVNGIKFDVASHTVVIDACVVPLVQGIMSKLLPSLHDITRSGVTSINTLADEIRAWKLLLPSLAERCRRWTHTDACEYRTKGVPASLDGTEQSPLCSCGKGKNLGQFGTVAEWAPFHEEATRIAIGPLFTFSFMEETLKSLMDSAGPESVQWKSQCATCARPGRPKLRACAACLKTRYCSRECQKAHWKIHKADCVVAKAE